MDVLSDETATSQKNKKKQNKKIKTKKTVDVAKKRKPKERN